MGMAMGDHSHPGLVNLQTTLTEGIVSLLERVIDVDESENDPESYRERGDNVRLLAP